MEPLPKPLVLKYDTDKYYLINGEFVLSLQKALNMTPDILQATINVKIKEDGSIKPEQTVFISSDCLLTFKIASDFFDKFYYNEGDVVHTAIEGGVIDTGMFKVLSDLLTLCNCRSTLYLGWNCNFSRIAALFNPKRKFISYEYDNNPSVVKEVSNDTLFSYHSNGKYT